MEETFDLTDDEVKGIIDDALLLHTVDRLSTSQIYHSVISRLTQIRDDFKRQKERDFRLAIDSDNPQGL